MARNMSFLLDPPPVGDPFHHIKNEMSKNSIDEFYKSLEGGLNVLRWDCQFPFLHWPAMACLHARISVKYVPDSIRIYRLVIDGFNPRLDFSHRPKAKLEVSAIDVVHEVIPLGI
jgi:hypothetical protein